MNPRWLYRLFTRHQFWSGAPFIFPWMEIFQSAHWLRPSSISVDKAVRFTKNWAPFKWVGVYLRTVSALKYLKGDKMVIKALETLICSLGLFISRSPRKDFTYVLTSDIKKEINVTAKTWSKQFFTCFPRNPLTQCWFKYFYR